MTDEDEVEKKQYYVRLMVTARVYAEENFEAVDDEAARKYVEALNARDFLYAYSSDDGIEGDEIAFWRSDEDGDIGNEEEVVLKKNGEPFSWDACNIVKDLAKLYADPTVDNIDTLTELISRAHRACENITGGMEG